MGAATALHVGIRSPSGCISVIAAGPCGYGSSADPNKVEEARAASHETGKMFAEKTMEESHEALTVLMAWSGRRTRTRTRALRAFRQDASEHSPLGHSLIMLNLQAKRRPLENGSRPEEIQTAAAGDRRREDDWWRRCSIYLRRTVPTRAVRLPRTGHTLTSGRARKIPMRRWPEFSPTPSAALARAQSRNSQTNPIREDNGISNSKARLALIRRARRLGMEHLP